MIENLQILSADTMMRTVLLVTSGNLEGVQKNLTTYPQNIHDRDENGECLVSLAIREQYPRILTWLLTHGGGTCDSGSWSTIVKYFGQTNKHLYPSLHWTRRASTAKWMLRTLLVHGKPSPTEFSHLVNEFPLLINMIHDGYNMRRKFIHRILDATHIKNLDDFAKARPWDTKRRGKRRRCLLPHERQEETRQRKVLVTIKKRILKKMRHFQK